MALGAVCARVRVPAGNMSMRNPDPLAPVHLGANQRRLRTMNDQELCKIEESARGLFKHLDNKDVPKEGLEPSKSEICPDIPVVSEWTSGTGKVLVFNTLNSCVGLIGIGTKDELFGVHLSYNPDHCWLKERDLKERIQNKFKNVRAKVHFGGSATTPPWDTILGNLLVNEFTQITEDKNEKCWVFWIEGNEDIKHRTFERPQSV